MPGTYEPPEAGDAPDEVKRILREVYQSCREDNPGEDHAAKEKCARIAWAAVKKAGYRKDAEGKWVKGKKNTADEGDVRAFTSMGAVGLAEARMHTVHSFENTILQKLEEWIPDEKTGSYNPAKPFEDNVDTWDGCPVVYGGDGVHPDPRVFEDDPEAAMEAVRKKTGKRCEIVGSISNPRVEIEGQPRLMATLSFDDQEAYQLWKEGKLRVSTALFVREKDNIVVEVVKANHVLIFPADAAGQGDKGALIMNTQHKDNMKPGQWGGRGIVHTALEKLKRAVDELGQALHNDQADEAHLNADAKDYVPRDPPGYGRMAEDAGWEKPVLGDFTSKRWEELTDAEKREVASCYAYVGSLDDFGSLKLPHHDPKTKNVVWNGVRAAMAAAMGARGGVDLGTKKEEVISHLAAHYKDFDKEKPASETNTMVGRDGITNMIDELKSNLEQEVTALKNAVAEKEAKLNTLQAERDTVKAELEKYKAAEADRMFQAFLNTLPKGLYHKPEDRIALRKKWDEDPRGLIVELAPKMNTGKETGQAGEEHDVKNTGDLSQEEYMKQRKTIGSIVDEQRRAGGR